MDFGLIIIGSELLTGRRQDGHMPRAISALGRRGLDLSWCLIVGDAPRQVTETLKHAMAGDDAVFCFGGIGATPDDHTRACAAAAAGVALSRHPEAARIIEEQFGDGAYPQRIHMADLPEGCRLIPNPVNQVPGFSIGNLHFIPGFPHMAWPMMDSVLDTRYAHLFKAEGPVELLYTIPDTSEGQLIEIMQGFVARYPDLWLSCLPHVDGKYRETELGIRGEREAARAAAQWLIRELEQAGFTPEQPE